MLQGLTKLVQYFTLPADEVIDRRLRKQEMDKVKQYCETQGYDFYPEELIRLPTFAGEVNRFIENRARRDLPQEQFEDKLTLYNLSKWVEVGGILGYSSHLYEMNYWMPDSTNVRLEVSSRTRAKIISSGPEFQSVLRKDFEKAKFIIDWHTHPVGFGGLSEEDADYIKESLEIFGKDKPIYSIVFRPTKNQSVWYQAKKV